MDWISYNDKVKKFIQVDGCQCQALQLSGLDIIISHPLQNSNPICFWTFIFISGRMPAYLQIKTYLVSYKDCQYSNIKIQEKCCWNMQVKSWACFCFSMTKHGLSQTEKMSVTLHNDFSHWPMLCSAMQGSFCVCVQPMRDNVTM